jgi:murein DD-endopeptidase MepM/ murein hydrolase activator NlpD
MLRTSRLGCVLGGLYGQERQARQWQAVEDDGHALPVGRQRRNPQRRISDHQQRDRQTGNPVVRVIAGPSSVRSLLPSPNGDEGEASVLDAEVAEVPGDAEETLVERPKHAKSNATRQPKVLELDLKAGPVPLRQYLEQKNPTSDYRKSLLIAAWMKANLSLDEVTMDHIYTGYRHMGWPSPKDVSSPMRSMKRQNGWFGKGKEKGAYAINHVGIDAAERTNGE